MNLIEDMFLVKFCKFISKDLLKLINMLLEQFANRQKYNLAKFYGYAGKKRGAGAKIQDQVIYDKNAFCDKID